LKETLTRSLTGALFVAAIVASLLLHPWVYLAMFTLVCVLAWVEYLHFYPAGVRGGLHYGGGLLMAAFFISAFLLAGERAGGIVLVAPLFILVVLLLQDQINRIQAWKLRIFILLSGWLYIALTLSSLHWMAYRLDPGGGYSYRWILYTLVFLWTYDTMAYVTGRLAGRHVIWKKVSPGKTWEGAAGGVLFTVGLAYLLFRQVGELGLAEWVVFGIIVAVAGTLGDFLESRMKRGAGLKDSGRILPGHGGVLDRFDSLLVSAPFVTLYLYIVISFK
jgi:phosphatidate cytidylyltransferase